MTEAEWLAATDPLAMHAFLRDPHRSAPSRWARWFTRAPIRVRLCERKSRLFACACCMRIMDLIPTEASRECVRVAERFADGQAGRAELDGAISASMTACDRAWREGRPWPLSAMAAINAVSRVHRTEGGGRGGTLRPVCEARATAVLIDYLATPGVETDGTESVTEYPQWIAAFAAEQAAQAALLRDVMGNSFRPARLDPRWRTADAVAVARGIYEDDAFDRLPILADALMDAGCHDETVLGHCRDGGLHARGCWVVDRILCRE